MMAAPRAARPARQQRQHGRARQEHGQRSKRHLVGVIPVRASGTTSTAASGRATSRFHMMSFGFRVRR